MELVEFKKYLSDQDRSPLTISAYMRDIKLFSNWFEDTNPEQFTPEALTPTDIKEYKRHLLIEQKAKPATINRRLIAIHVFCRWAQSTGLIDYDPTREIKAIGQQELAPKWLDKRQQFSILRTVEKRVLSARTDQKKAERIRDKAIVTVLLHTGIRISELCALEISDIVLSDRKGSLTIRHGKGTKARIVPLSENARKVLREWLDIRPKIISQALFTGSRSGLKVRAIQDMLSKVSKDSQILFSARSLRSTFAKNLINGRDGTKQVGIEQVAVLMGHTSINTTRLYVIPSQQDLENTIEILDG